MKRLFHLLLAIAMFSSLIAATLLTSERPTQAFPEADSEREIELDRIEMMTLNATEVAMKVSNLR